MDGKEKMAKKKLTKGQKTSRNLIILIVSLLVVIIAVTVGIIILISNYYNKMNYIEDDKASAIASSEVSESKASEMAQEAIDEAIEIMTDAEGNFLSDEAKASIAAELESIAAEQAANINANINSSQVSREGVYNILLIGTDLRNANAGWAGNSDSIILCTINNNKKTITLTSFMRDLYIILENYGASKINRAHAIGAGPLLVKTIEQNFGINIDYYATVNFFTMIDIVNKIGGIDIAPAEGEINAEVIKWANVYIDQMCKLMGLDPAGYRLAWDPNKTYHLNGVQAVGFARIRYTAGWDYKRTERQRIVLTKIFQKLQNSDLGTISNFLNSCLPNITTNMPEDFVLSLINAAPTYLTYQFQPGYRVPFDDIGFKSINGLLLTDYNRTRQKMESYMY